MVSAVHLQALCKLLCITIASKGLHMVSAVHLKDQRRKVSEFELQRGCTWLVQFIPSVDDCSRVYQGASKGLHMVSAVHLEAQTTGLQDEKLQRGCTWLVQFINHRPQPL